MCWPNLKSVALSVPEILANGVLGGVANLQSRERGHRGVGNGTIQRALVSSYGPSIVKLILCLYAFRRYWCFVLQHATFPDPNSSLPHNFSVFP